MRSARAGLLVLLLVSLLGRHEAAAQAPLLFKPVILAAGRWLTGVITGYIAGKGIDKLVGEDWETKLEAVEEELVAELGRDNPNKAQLQAQLDATRHQLQMLETLLRSQPTVQQLNEFKQQLTTDIERVMAVQREHGVRIDKLERDMQEVLDRLRSFEAEKESTSLRRRPEADSRKLPPRQSGGPSRERGREGVTLEIRVTGTSNTIEVQEVEDWESADFGTFFVSGRGDRRTFRLLRPTGAVLLVLGDDNTVRIPVRLCRRARVADRGSRTTVRGCP